MTRRSIDSTIALPRRLFIGSVPRIRALRNEHRLPPGTLPGSPATPHGNRFQAGDLRVGRHLPYTVERRPMDSHGISRRCDKAGEGGGHPFRASLEAVRMRGAKFAPRNQKKTIDRLLGEFGRRACIWEEKGAFAVTVVNWSIARHRALPTGSRGRRRFQGGRNRPFRPVVSRPIHRYRVPTPLSGGRRPERAPAISSPRFVRSTPHPIRRTR